ncbi:hypothetical protein STSP2_00090 [Anaerohalosphaera lusitana]|uniref:PEP-CTERM protein-sorting domain-containing protein n=1 Tax=Anaerohalosphaera lusitana TaxID=1936003 RepID=A0A1U9NG94_9BACT|nr:PEP-CTERM sorting domain-containing protein [Anaerohalosphaera lusitana]AQT66952.1 hypothetical protein STSP2_00090 [Anaerohalosphaera lusitana]
MRFKGVFLGAVLIAAVGGFSLAGVETSYDISVYYGYDNQFESDSATDGSPVSYDGRWAGYEPGQIIIAGSTWDATAAAEIDTVNGTYRTKASAMAYVDDSSAEDDYWVMSEGVINIRETLTFSQATTVTLTGSVHGNLAAQVSHSWNGNASASTDISWNFENPEIWTEDRWFGYYSDGWSADVIWNDDGTASTLPGTVPSTPDINETFSVEVDVPAGTILFNMEIESAAMAQAYLYGDATSANADALSDFGNTVLFEMQFEPGVTVTSEGGLFPVNVVPEPASLVFVTAGAACLIRRRRA